MNKAIPICMSLAVLYGSVFNGIPALAADQTGRLELQRPGIVLIREPESFVFPATFIPTSGTFNEYAFLDPSLEASSLAVFDSDDSSGFSITVAMTDLQPTLSGSTIHYTNLALVTLSLSPDGVDGNPINIPPGTAHVTAPASCPWTPPNPDMQSQCDAYMISFSEPSGGSPESQPVTIMQNNTASDFGAYSIGFGFRLNIASTFRQDLYSGTLIFTVIASP